MSKKLLDQFGFLLMQQVRDDVIILMDKMIDGNMVGQSEDPFNKYFQALTSDAKGALHMLAPIMVDLTLQFFLSLIENQENLDLIMTGLGDRQSLKYISNGLSNELHTANGWISRFSNQRNFEQEIFGDHG